MTKCTTLLATAIACMALSSTALADNRRVWDFTISLDGDPVGTHTFTVDGKPGAWHVTSKANFTVTMLGVTVFHYRHSAYEQWNQQCVSQMTVDTDHNGDISHVTVQGTADGGTVWTANGQSGNAGEQQTWTGCLMNYAYWNPHMREQTRLLNPETGMIETVSITRAQDMTITSHGQTIAAHVWRITGSTNPIDVLYDDQDNWVGLDAKVRGGRILSYRLQ